MASVMSIVRSVLVSPEMLIITIAAYLILDTPDFMARIAIALAEGPDAVRYIALIPAAVFVWSIAEAKSILLPGEDTKALLQNWSRYPDLKGRVAIGLCFQFIFAFAALSMWVYSPKLDDPKSFVVAGMSVIGCLVCGSTFLMAAIAARGMTKRANA